MGKAQAQTHRVLMRNRIRDTSISFEARGLWVLIESYANRDGTNAFPNIATLAALTKHNLKWVEKYLKELKDAQWLSVGKRKTSSGWCNEYTLGHPENWCDPLTPKTYVTGHPQKGGVTYSQLTVSPRRGAESVPSSHEEADAIAAAQRNGLHSP